MTDKEKETKVKFSKSRVFGSKKFQKNISD